MRGTSARGMNLSLIFSPLACLDVYDMCSCFGEHNWVLTFGEVLSFVFFFFTSLLLPISFCLPLLMEDKGYRRCENGGCNRRLASILYDPHSHCKECRGSDCSLEHKCSICDALSVEEFNRHLKYQLRRDSDKVKGQRRKTRKRESSSPHPVPSTSSSIQPPIVQEVVADVHAPDLSSPHARPSDPDLFNVVLQLQTSHQQLIAEQSLFRETLASLLAGRKGVNPPGLSAPSAQPLREADMRGAEDSPGRVSCPPLPTRGV